MTLDSAYFAQVQQLNIPSEMQDRTITTIRISSDGYITLTLHPCNRSCLIIFKSSSASSDITLVSSENIILRTDHDLQYHHNS